MTPLPEDVARLLDFILMTYSFSKNRGNDDYRHTDHQPEYISPMLCKARNLSTFQPRVWIAQRLINVVFVCSGENPVTEMFMVAYLLSIDPCLRLKVYLVDTCYCNKKKVESATDCMAGILAFASDNCFDRCEFEFVEGIGHALPFFSSSNPINILIGCNPSFSASSPL
jgi:hypothetical protein